MAEIAIFILNLMTGHGWNSESGFCKYMQRYTLWYVNELELYWSLTVSACVLRSMDDILKSRLKDINVVGYIQP